MVFSSQTRYRPPLCPSSAVLLPLNRLLKTLFSLPKTGRWTFEEAHTRQHGFGQYRGYSKYDTISARTKFLLSTEGKLRMLFILFLILIVAYFITSNMTVGVIAIGCLGLWMLLLPKNKN